MDKTRSWAQWLAVHDSISSHIPFASLLNKAIRFGISKMLGYSTKTLEVMIGLERLKEKYGFSKFIDSIESIDAYWLTGLGIITENGELFRRGLIRKIMLPHPEITYKSLENLRGSLGIVGPAYNIVEQIRSTTKYAQHFHVPVKWLHDFPTVSLTIINTKDGDGWIHQDIIWPFIDGEKRQIMRIERKREGGLFMQYQDAFNKLWDSSTDAPKL